MQGGHCSFKCTFAYKIKTEISRIFLVEEFEKIQWKLKPKCCTVSTLIQLVPGQDD